MIGSIKDAKKAPVENIARVIEILDNLIAAKKVIQCKAIKTPTKKNLIKLAIEIDSLIFLSFMNMNIIINAINIRYQTSGIASKEISSPNTPVKPAMKTRK